MNQLSPPSSSSLLTGVILVALVAMGQVSVALYIPSMPAIASDFSVDTGRVTLTLTLFLAAFAIAQLVYGPISDRYGRRRALLGGIVLYIGASILCATATGIAWLTLARFLQALGACSGPVLGRAMVRDIYGRDQAAKVMAYVAMAFAISPALTPLIGGILQVTFGWRSNFVALTLFGAVMLAAVWHKIGETHAPAEPIGVVGMIRTYGLLLRDRSVMGNIACASLVFAGLMSFTASAPFLFIERLSFSPDTFGALAVFNVLGMVAGNFAVSRLTHRLGHARMIAYGVSISLVSAAVMAGIALNDVMNATVIIAPMAFYLFGMGLVFPNAMAGALSSHPRAAGSASALIGFCQMAAAAVASRISGLLPHDTQIPMALVILACGLAAFLSYLLWVRPRKPENEKTAP